MPAAAKRYDVVKYKTPTGSKLSCKGWVQEAALRMLLNNLDPAVAERPEDLIVYGGRGKAARNFESLDLIIEALKDLGNNETLLVQSGKPVGIMQTHTDAPRVLISNSQLVPNWANWKHFTELEQKGLMMYGQMTAGSWIYIGSQGIVQGTYETFAAVANKHFNGSLLGTLSVTAGLGGMGGAQPLAITMNSGVCLVAEVEEWRGLKYSTFASTVQGKSLVILFSLIKGVLPIVSIMLLSHIHTFCSKGMKMRKATFFYSREIKYRQKITS